MKPDRAQAGYSILNFFYWAATATVCSFCSAFLLPLGFSSFEIGLIMSFGNAGSVLLQAPLADFTDRTKQYTITRILAAAAGLLLLLSGLLLALRGRSLFLAVFYTLAYIVHVSMVPLLNELNYRLSKAGYEMNFGAARAIGSLGYSIMCALAGFAAESFGTRIYPVLTILVVLVILGILAVLGRLLGPYGCGAGKPSGRESSENMSAFIRTHRNLFMVSIGSLFLMFNTTIMSSYLLQIVMDVGGGEKEMGLGLSLAAFMEIPVMFFYQRLRKRYPVKTLLRASGIGYILKHGILFLAGAYPLVLVSQAFQSVSFALFLPSSVDYAHEHTEDADSVKGQALMTIAGNAAGLLASLMGGFVIDIFGVRVLLLVCVAMSVLGTVLIFIYTRENTGNETGRETAV